MGQGFSQSTSAISACPAGQSSGNHSANTSAPTSSSSASSVDHFASSSSSSSVDHSTRIQSMIENRNNYSSEVEFNIEYSRIHWSILTGSATDNTSTSLKSANCDLFKALKSHHERGAFFKDIKVVFGEKVVEGAQAEIYDAKADFGDGRKCSYGNHVVKLAKGDCSLQYSQTQWPVGMLRNFPIDSSKGPLIYIKGGTLHGECGIVHRGLTASNVLLWSLGEELPDENPHVRATVVDYECSVGVMGTGFWRAPEILQQVKDKVPRSIKCSDVYIRRV